MSKKNLNWGVPNDLADVFDDFAMSRFGGKGKWLAAVAAIAMYIEADDAERARCDRLALGTMIEGGDSDLAMKLGDKAKQIIAERPKIAAKIAAKIAKPLKHGVPAKSKRQT